MNKGLAGAGVAYYHGVLIGGNPAGHVFLGKSISVGVALFSPIRSYTITGNPSGLPGTFGLAPGEVESETNIFVIPNLGFNWMINDDSAFGISIYGNGGMNTDYPTRTFGDMNIETTGVNLAQLFANFTYSRKLGEKHSVGVSAIVAYQMFEAEGLSNFAPFSDDANNLTNNDTDNGIGFGFKVGYMGEITDGLTIGASYQSKMFMNEFEDYAGLFAEQGGFDIPATWAAGLAFEVSDKLTLVLDVKQILYSDIPSIANPIDPMALPPAFLNPGGDPNNPADYTPNPNHVGLGADNASGFGWEDMTVIKFGAEIQASEDMTLRLGYSYGNQPIPDSEVLFNILAPGVIENHLALGLSKGVGESGNQIHFSFNYAFNNTVSGFNPFDFDPAQAANGVFVPNQSIDLEMYQLDFEVGFSF